MSATETLQRKICLLGAIAVGKTSLVRRYVESVFSERYQATIGVQIDRKAVDVDGQRVNLVIWDMQGDDDVERVRTSYLRGASGVILVADGTRPETLDAASLIRAGAVYSLGPVPTVLLLNKSDLHDSWRMDDVPGASREWDGVRTLRTSAKSGENVDEAFATLASRMLAG